LIAIRPAFVNLAAISPFAASTKSVKVLLRLSSLPSRYQC